VTNDELIYEAKTFALLSRVLSYPNADLAAITRELADMYTPDSERYAAIMVSVDACDGVMDLRRDYTALFIGALKMLAPPYASYYLDGEALLGGPTCVAVAKEYAERGFKFSPEHKCPADNLAHMCEFVFALLRRAAGAQDNQLRNRDVFAAEHFYVTYIRPWINDFCERVTEFATTDYYRGMGEWLRGVLMEDCLLEATFTELVEQASAMEATSPSAKIAAGEFEFVA
jgi:TorA maturation chaperone TorD